MAYENSAGLGIHNHYGPRIDGGSQGVFKTEGYRNEYVIDGASQGLPYLFPRGGGVFVNGHDFTYAIGTVTSILIGGIEVIGATEAAPIHIPAENTGEVVVTGLTGGKAVVFFKKVASYEPDVLPAFPAPVGVISYVPVSGVDVTPATASVAVGAKRQLSASVSPANVSDGGLVWYSSDVTKATVNSAGLVTGVAAGTATITARSVADQTKFDTSVITVS